MSHPIIVTNFAYKGLKRSGRGTERQGLKATLKYFQFRDKRNNHLAQVPDYERWQDHGMGVSHGEIYQNCDTLSSKHVLAWTWVISPAPDLMALVPEAQRRELIYELTERVVEDYYTERGFDTPEYSYVLHSAPAPARNPKTAKLNKSMCIPTSCCPALHPRLATGCRLKQCDQGARPPIP